MYRHLLIPLALLIGFASLNGCSKPAPTTPPDEPFTDRKKMANRPALRDKAPNADQSKN
jgi:hypothetical protein